MSLAKLKDDLDHGDQIYTVPAFETLGDNVRDLVLALIAITEAAARGIAVLRIIAEEANNNGLPNIAGTVEGVADYLDARLVKLGDKDA